MDMLAPHGFTLSVPKMLKRMRDSALRPKAFVCRLPGIPTISMMAGRMRFADVSLNLRRKPKMARLFAAFIDSHKGEMYRDDVLRAIYPREHQRAISRRMRVSMEQNVLKLMSRARRAAHKHLSRNGALPMDWFMYDSMREIWQLCRMRNEYLVHVGFPRHPDQNRKENLATRRLNRK